MAFNVFEGARRICYAITGVIILTGGYFLIDKQPSEKIYYRVNYLNGPAIKTADTICPYNGRSTYLSRTTPQGHKVSIELCFMASTFNNGRDLIPFREDGSLVYGDTPYSDGVSSYIKRYESNFSLPETDAKNIDDSWITSWIAGKWDVVKVTGIIVGAFWLFVYLVGWIVRGFAGIPLNKDHRNIN